MYILSKKCGIGCVLSTKEFKNFIKRYYERHPDLSENEIKTLNLSITESTFGERSFKRSDGHGFFTFKEIDPEYNDEIKLFPLKQKNKCNQSYIDLQKKNALCNFMGLCILILIYQNYSMYHLIKMI